jgi:hypothetical protein
MDKTTDIEKLTQAEKWVKDLKWSGGSIAAIAIFYLALTLKELFGKENENG